MSVLPKARHTHIDAISDKAIARALIDNQGLQYLAAEQLNIAATWLSIRIKQSEYLQAVRQACIELRIDKAEKVLCDMVEAGNFPAVALTLRTLGRSRGYAETGYAVNPAESIKAFNDTMAIWGMKQVEAQNDQEGLLQAQGEQIDLKSDDTSISSDS